MINLGVVVFKESAPGCSTSTPVVWGEGGYAILGWPCVLPQCIFFFLMQRVLPPREAEQRTLVSYMKKVHAAVCSGHQIQKKKKTESLLIKP